MRSRGTRRGRSKMSVSLTEESSSDSSSMVTRILSSSSSISVLRSWSSSRKVVLVGETTSSERAAAVADVGVCVHRDQWETLLLLQSSGILGGTGRGLHADGS